MEPLHEPHETHDPLVPPSIANGLVTVAGRDVEPGERADVFCIASEGYTGDRTTVPVSVLNGAEPGPRVFITAAIHGDELNGIAVCRDLLNLLDPAELRGCVVVAPIVNVLGAQIHSRYLPDRRDLNRSFPGSKTGSIAARLARLVMDEVVTGSSVGIDLHTAANRRTNVPQLRVDVDDPIAVRLGEAFAAPYILSASLRPGSLREVAGQQGIPVLTFEGGEALRFDDDAVRVALDGIQRVLQHLGMRDTGPGPAERAPIVMHESRWLRAERGGIIDLHVDFGEHVEAGQPLWTTTGPFGSERSTMEAPEAAVVIGGTTLPLLSPGDAVLHLAFFGDRAASEDDPSAEEDATARD